MAVKSIIDVEVNDAEFKDFAATFEKYQQALAKTPKDWDASAKAQRPTVAAFQGIAAALLAQSALQAKRLKSLKDEAKVEKDSSSYWKDMARSSREVAANASSIAKSVLSTIGVGSIFSGLLGAGGLYGLDALAGSVGGFRRTALGLGSTIGETRAFGLNYGRIVDTNSVIGGVQEALTDPTKRAALYGAGLTEGDLQGKDAAQVAALLIKRVGTLVDRTPTSFLGSVGTAFQLGQFGLGTQELQRLQQTPAGERAEYFNAFNRDRVRLNVPDKQAKAYQDFYVQLSRAGEQIENVFVRGIAPLVPALTKFSESVVTTIANFADRLVRSGALDKFAGAIQGFADYLGTDAFQANVKTFADDIVALGGVIHKTLVFLGAVPDKAHPNDSPTERIGGGFHDRIRENAPGIDRGDHLNAIGGALSDFFNPLTWIGIDGGRDRLVRRGLTPGQIATETQAIARLRGVIGSSGYSITSSYRDPATDAAVGGRGGSHLIPGAGFDLSAPSARRAAMLRELRSAGYFAFIEPDGHIHASTAGDRGGRNVRGYGYVNGQPAGRYRGPEVTVRLENATGGNVVVSANQLRGQAFQ